MENKKAHWENVFTTKTETEVSWFQEKPETSLNFVKEFNLQKNAKIIDIGAGDSHFIDALLDLGFTNLYLLDISAKAIERIQERLGEKSKNVTFIVSDILDFHSEILFDFWHDRASFHFFNSRRSDSKICPNCISIDCKKREISYWYFFRKWTKKM
ncbi:class I SAM-dependent methyltransferase [Flavobacterium psychrophilum]|uniref:class I SAM-dependent methyltransferase n=1 Tax=Flavobacterium psychrophilum TaxID=96345 RepID=UPI000AD4416B